MRIETAQRCPLGAVGTKSEVAALKWKLALTLVSGLVVGFFAAIAMQSLLDGFLRSHTKRSIADCRTISSALEAYRSANGRYPPLENGVEGLKAHLVPQHLRVLPERDSFNRPYLVFTNGPTAVVLSTGRYGVVVEGGRVSRAADWGELQATAPN